MSKEHFGIFLRRSIEQIGIKKKEAAMRIGVADVTLRYWFSLAAPNIRPENRINIAKLLQVPIEVIDNKLLSAMNADPKTQKIWAEQLRRLQEAKSVSSEAYYAEWIKIQREQELMGESPDEFEIDANAINEIVEVPTFKLSVAAGPWTDVLEVAELHNQKQIDDGRFRIYIQGDSMEPKYSDGSLIEFQCLRDGGPIGDGSKLSEGKDYYVQVGDRATFKRLVKIEEENLVFKAINKKKYPKLMPAKRIEIVRMAQAEWVLTRAGE